MAGLRHVSYGSTRVQGKEVVLHHVPFGAGAWKGGGGR